MAEFLEVRTTIDSEEGARKIAQQLVEQRLAACVQISGPIQSVYWWQGTLEQAQEWLCSAKTRADLYSAVEQAIRTAHTYEEPEIIALPLVAGSAGYLRWLETETRSTSGDQA
ncbi:divalent-cation tolerance protein CutA [Thermogemmatispora sp.]|uniref:divalent-cation tolerance protein CutA n=1 Tax=Thermogemmatispora sp. TaxID=1968838 RepID=UPI00261323BE|nr:divalent-cation tolerance protein CutA [Thermogemmatispora sp.]